MSKHGIRHVVEAVYGTPWVITEAKLAQILDVIERRQSGHMSAEELEAFTLPTASAEESKPYTLTPGGVAVMSLSGLIAQRMNLMSQFSGGTSTEQFGADFRAALRDPNVKAIVFDVNSPGGTVSGTPEVADLIHAARGTKPIIAVANTQMASGAYWIGSAADEIVASPSANVGSIGVLYIHAERSQLDAKAGITRSIIKAGRWKGLGNDAQPLTEESRAKLQSWVDSGYSLFVEAVARNRGVTVNRVQTGFGEGDSLMAREAKSEGLVDRIATLDEVVSQLETKLGASAASTRNVPSNSKPVSFPRGTRIMDPKVKAALFARGLIPAVDTPDESAQVALSAYYAGKGATVPTEPAAVIADLFGQVKVEATDAKSADLSAAAKAEQDLVDRVAARMKVEADYRVNQVTAACSLVGLDATATKAIVDKGLSIEASRVEIRNALTGHNEPLQRIEAAAAEAEKFAVAAEEALTARCMSMAAADPEGKAPTWSVPFEKLSAGAKEIYGYRMIDLAAESLRQQGVRTKGLPPTRIADLAMRSDQPHLLAAAGGAAYYTTGSFANLTLNSARKVLMRAYTEAPVTWRMWARQGESVADFKLNKIVKFGEASDFGMVPENQPYPTDTGLTDSSEYFVVETFGYIHSFSRQLIINDDLSALSRLPRMQGTAAARKFNKLVYAILTGNPNMADGVALFVAASSRGTNLLGTGTTTAAPPSVSTLQAVQAVMRKQHGLNSDSTLNTALRYVIAPVALEATTMQLITSISDPASSNSNVKNYFANKVLPVIEPLLDATSAAQWYGAADPSVMDTIEVRFLQGEETPYLESEWDFSTDTRKHKIRQTGAAVLVDFRGLVKHVGFSA